MTLSAFIYKLEMHGKSQRIARPT